MNIDKDTYLEAPLRLRNGQVFSSNGYWLMPAPGYAGHLIEVVDNHDVIIQNTRIKNATLGIKVEGKTNNPTFQNVKIVDCKTGIESISAWDSHYHNVCIQRCDNGIELKGNLQRASVPATFIDLHIEAFRQSAIIVRMAHNLVFSACKFHGQQGNEPDNNTIKCLDDAYPRMLFTNGTKFYFNRSKHFDIRQKPAVELVDCWYDRIEDMGNVTMHNCKKTR